MIKLVEKIESVKTEDLTVQNPSKLYTVIEKFTRETLYDGLYRDLELGHDLPAVIDLANNMHEIIKDDVYIDVSSHTLAREILNAAIDSVDYYDLAKDLIEEVNIDFSNSNYRAESIKKSKYDLDENLISEKIPKDLVKAYKDAEEHDYINADSDYYNKIDLENSEYTEISPEEAMEIKKSGNLHDLDILVNGKLVKYYNDGRPEYSVYVDHKSRYVNRNGKSVYETKYMPFKYVLTIADKIYKVNRVAVGEDKLKSRGVGKDDTILDPIVDRGYWNNVTDPGFKGSYGSQRSANAQLGKLRPGPALDTWDENSLQRAKDRLANIEAQYAAGDMSKNDYERQKADYENTIKTLTDKKNRANWNLKNDRANARNYTSNADATRAIRKLKMLKTELSRTSSDLQRAESKYNDISDEGSDSHEFEYQRKRASELRHKISILQSQLSKIEAELQAADDGTKAQEAKADVDNLTSELSSIKDQLKDLLAGKK